MRKDFKVPDKLIEGRRGRSKYGRVEGKNLGEERLYRFRAWLVGSGRKLPFARWSKGHNH